MLFTKVELLSKEEGRAEAYVQQYIDFYCLQVYERVERGNHNKSI
ncbi:hypothetical protein [Bacillus cereus]|nr:hypothetical protein [Bacillus cereus]MEC3196176.1 hypothetical protein [Bacillus cereus]